MLLRSKLVRNEIGVNPPVPVKVFVVELGADRERKYEFRLDKDGDHVCDVKDHKDIATLLAISEGYEVHPSAIDAAEKAGLMDADKDAKARAAAEKKEQEDRTRVALKGAVDDLDHDELIEAYTKDFGKAPKKGMSDDEMRDALKAHIK